MNKDYHRENIKVLKDIFKTYPNADMWAAWGAIIETRPYFYKALKDIYNVSKKYELNWVHLNKLTKRGHPRHPLYLRADSQVFEFNIEKYIGDNCKL